MRIWQQHSLGDPVELLRLEEVDDPVVDPGKVLVEVEAVGLTFVDCLMARGMYQATTPIPWSPGTEIVGRVTEVGEGVQDLEPGQRVVGVGGGGVAERAALRASGLYSLDENVTAGAAAALLVNYGTSWFALHDRAQLAAGETLLVHAAMGGVGTAAVQLGMAAGARIIATAGGADKTARLSEMGVELAVDYLETPDFVDLIRAHTDGRGVDVCFDPVGGDVFDRSRRVMAWDGRLLVIGFTSGRIPEAPANHVLLKNYSIVGVHWGASIARNPQASEQAHQRLLTLLQEERINPPVFPPFAFEDTPAALGAIYNRSTWGKVIVQR